MTAPDAFTKNIRSITGLDDTELYESLKHHGWHPELPALADESGVVLVGHRRMRLAKQLGIEPVIRTITFGNGDASDAERVRLAIVSNVGSQPFSRDDRKRIAEYLYGTKEWTMEAIAKALDVSHQTVGRDLADLSTVDKSKSAKTATNPKGAGRPKGTGKREIVRVADELAKGATLRMPTREERYIRQLEARVRELEALVLPLDDEGKDAVRQYKRKVDRDFKVQWRRCEEVIKKRHWIVDEKTYTVLLAGLHPDVEEARKYRDRARAILEGYKKRKLIFTKTDTVKWPPDAG